MNLREQLKLILMREGTSMAKTIRCMKSQGIKVSEPSNMSKKIKLETIKYKDVIDLLDFLGYKITIDKK